MTNKNQSYEDLTAPRISVIMGIYNCSATLREAVESVISQTITDWELILCDDGSTDDTYSIARHYEKMYPEKVRVLRNETNRGLNCTLNRCLEIANGDFIARMDGDDRCLPERFAEEIAVFEQEPDISIVSTDMGFFDESGVWGNISHPTYPQPEDFLHGTPFCHAPCMIRKSALDAVGGYSEDRKMLRVEDYHLWVRMYKAGFRGKNLHQQLYFMRDDRSAYGKRKFRFRWNEVYVRAYAVKTLKLSKWGYIFALRPILVGLLPSPIYRFLHKRNLRKG